LERGGFEVLGAASDAGPASASADAFIFP